jgi:hypothetical protein
MSHERCGNVVARRCRNIAIALTGPDGRAGCSWRYRPISAVTLLFVEISLQEHLGQESFRKNR